MSPVDVGLLTVIPAELGAARTALAFPVDANDKDENGTAYWCGQVRSETLGRSLSVALGCIGNPGNLSTAEAASSLLRRHRPRVMILMGIAAGIRGKVRIGEVVISDRVVAYEPAALVRDAHGRSTTQQRPEVDRIPHVMLQDLLGYLSAPVPQRLAEQFAAIGGVIVKPPKGAKREYEAHVVRRMMPPRLATIASGEKLLRDPGVLLRVRDEIHSKTEVGEMEAAGLVEACRRAEVPWLVIRGISDFGDELKCDDFHQLAARAAAAVLLDFVRHGLTLNLRRGAVQAQSPFVVGQPIARDQDFIGREHERRDLLDYVGKGAAVELLGEPLSGRTSLLYWLGRNAYPDRPVVRIDPASGLTPRSFVSAIARELRREDVVHALGRADADPFDNLKQLVPFVLLLDDADALATMGQGFSEEFFLGVRALVQSGKLVWVSASRTTLYEQFAARGLSSKFLNGSNKIFLGALDDASARQLVERGTTSCVDELIREAGRSPYALQWLVDHLVRHGTSFEEACDAFDDEMRRVFATRWRQLDLIEQQLLRLCATTDVRVDGLERRTRTRLRSLKRIGLVREERGCFMLEGASWERFVRDVE